MPRISTSLLAAAVVPLLFAACKGEGKRSGDKEATQNGRYRHSLSSVKPPILSDFEIFFIFKIIIIL